MNTFSDSVRILCYGDSNTWGHIPGTGDRYPVSVRWTGLLQQSLGEEFEIIEEGLNARTTVLDDPENEGKNGATYLKPCLQSQTPLDVVILLLGTNDMKERFHRTPEQIAQGIDTLLEIIHNPDYTYGIDPKVILLSPPFVTESIGNAQEKSKQLGALYQQVAEKYQADFIDLALHVTPSAVDGYHLEPEAHAKIAQLLTQLVMNQFTQDTV